MPYFIISIVIQLALVVHALKTGRNTTWVFIIMFFPAVGSLAYVILEILPEFMYSRSARSARAKLSKAINPQGDLRAAEEHYALAGTIKTAMLLAEQYLLLSRFADAKTLYQGKLTGIYRDDPQLLLGLAAAHFGLQEFTEAVQCLDLLKEKHPQSTTDDGHLLYAKCLQGLGRTQEALTEFEALAKYYAGPEPAYRLALLLKQDGQQERARALLEDILKRSKRGGRHYRYLHQEWVTLAKQELKS